MPRKQKQGLPPAIHLQTLQILLEIDTHGSASVVAKKFDMSVSAITRQIQELEERVGKIELVDRHSRGLRLTALGQTYANAARKAIDTLEDARATINLKRSERKPRSHRIRVHISEVLVENYFLPLLNKFAPEFPQVFIEVSVGSAKEACVALSNGDADFATMFGLVELINLEEYPNIKIIRKVPYPLVAVVHREHELSRRKSITVEELLRSGWPLALPPQGYSTRKHFVSLLNQIAPGLELNDFVEVEMNSFVFLKRYAALRRAIAILPDLAVESEVKNGTLVAIAIQGSETERTSFSFCRRRNQKFHPATKVLFERLDKTFRQLSGNHTDSR